MNDLALLVKEKADSASEIVHVPYEQAYEEGFEDMPRRVPDITKINRLLGWQPTIDVDEIVEKVIEFQRGGARLEEAVAHA
ncbi:MAG TPA: hypothetical protein VE734_13250, partial [Terriglobales bacterium]|nr:hypothetical protein [Terriglobales bacterium]